MYGVPFTKAAHIIDESSIFIPSGWDSLKKLDAERELIADPDAPLCAPVEELPLSGGREQQSLVESEDEQSFLKQLQAAVAEPQTEGRVSSRSF